MQHVPGQLVRSVATGDSYGASRISPVVFRLFSCSDSLALVWGAPSPDSGPRVPADRHIHHHAIIVCLVAGREINERGTRGNGVGGIVGGECK